MTVYSLESILDDTIFRRFNPSDQTKKYYYDRLNRFCTDMRTMDFVCMDLADSCRQIPTVSEVKKLYREYENNKVKENLSEDFTPSEKDTEAAKRFFKIKQELKYGKAYNQICFDNGWGDWLSEECKDAEGF